MENQNVQLSAKERTCVYLSTLTGRILGFGHESVKPMFAEEWKREILYHAIDIEKWAEKYRKQEEEDQQCEDYKRTLREAPARKAIRDALMERRKHVDAPNQAYIDANLTLMARREQRANTRKERFLLSEKYDMSKSAEEIALDSPAFKALG